jgi:cyclic beta-1,2-glucan synthetase
MRFIGRGHTLAAPQALEALRLSGTHGNVLDPVFALRRVFVLPPYSTVIQSFWLGAAQDRAAALDLASRVEEEIRSSHWKSAPFEAKDWGREAGASGAETPPRAEASPMPRSAVPPGDEPLQDWNGYGGFSASGRDQSAGSGLAREAPEGGGAGIARHEYVIRMPVENSRLKLPPLPWTNVVANEASGFLLSETGAGYVWNRNSREHRLTPWFNDPVLDPHGDALYLRDEDAGLFWSPLPGPTPSGAYECRHGFGYSRFVHDSHGILQESTLFMTRREPLRLILLRLNNHTARARSLSLFSYQRLVLGAMHQDDKRPIVTDWHAANQILLASNPGAGPFADGVAFAALGGTDGEVSFTTDRAAFLGDGGAANPAALRFAARLDKRLTSGPDACFALQTRLNLAPGETREIVLLFGESSGKTHALLLARLFASSGAARAALEAVCSFWNDTLDAVRVKTPEPAIDRLLNGWAAYQNQVCRLWARSAFYQSGGAYGYRDQLQDAAALIYYDPALTRRQILLHAAHQFVEGDVLHWWHQEPLEKGLRTCFADDLCWLPLVTAFYVATAGDASVLDESAPFLTARALYADEDEAYLEPTLSGASASVYEHCCRALDKALTQGAHGLPLFGAGDWNDGLSRVGREGRGESVWMGFFLYYIRGEFLPLCAARGDAARAERYRACRERYREALEREAWDGDWYRRAWYDDGAMLGSKDSDECQIDALAQAWAVISGAAPRERAERAMQSTLERLVSEQDHLIRLLTPPFENTPHDPGYIKGYVKGVRENGGQYTHAACWVVRALAELGWTDAAVRLLAMLSPLAHTRMAADVERYKLEPYVIAADIYGAEPHVGRGGWSWYTGSAGWYFRVALESVLGLKLENGAALVVRPRIPDAWPEYRIDYRLPGDRTRYALHVLNPDRHAGKVVAVTVDGAELHPVDGAARIPLTRDGQLHDVEIRLG